MKRIILIIFALSPFAQACDLTQEYRELRTEFVQSARYPYRACTDSVNAFHYWQAVAECEALGSGKSIGGGCQHLIASKPSKVERRYDHCEIFEVSYKDIEVLFEQYVKEHNITRCSTSQPPAAGQPQASLEAVR